MIEKLDSALVNHTNSLRDEYKDIESLTSNLSSLKIMVKISDEFLEELKIKKIGVSVLYYSTVI